MSVETVEAAFVEGLSRALSGRPREGRALVPWVDPETRVAHLLFEAA